MRQPKVCLVCHAPFVARSERQATCSNRCYMFNSRNPGLSDAPADCLNCGQQLVAGRHRAQVYCSPRCGTAYSKRKRLVVRSPYVRHTQCEHCSAELNGKAGRRYCNEQCERRERDYPGSASYFANRRCEYCDQRIPAGARYNKRHCTNRCTVLANQVIRRARRAGRPVERLSRHRIFERDGWMCHICGEPVDPTIADPDPQCATLDHLIPFCDPDCPGHIATNVALAHMRCNVVKNGRTRPEDWALHRALVAAAASTVIHLGDTG